MKLINQIGVETQSGYCTVELHEGDICSSGNFSDVLVISAFKGSYYPTFGSVIASIESVFRLNVESLANSPAIDLRSALGFWISRQMPESVPFSRLACVEMLGTGRSTQESLENLFVGLMVAEAKHIPAKVVTLPLLGTGSQGLKPSQIAADLVSQCKLYLERASTIEKIVFVEKDPARAAEVSVELDHILGRQEVKLDHEVIVEALRNDIILRLMQCDSLFEGRASGVREGLRDLLQDEIRSVEFGIRARQLVELLVGHLKAPKGSLQQRIQHLATIGNVAPWTCSYMHLIRLMGNEAAHGPEDNRRRVPASISQGDLTVCLLCILRLLEFWEEHQGR